MKIDKKKALLYNKTNSQRDLNERVHRGLGYNNQG